MPKVSKESAAHVEDHGPVEDRHEDIDGYTVNFLTFRVDIDGAPLLKGLPHDQCNCPHWGYVLKGRCTVRYTDGVSETLAAGEAYYIRPGHNVHVDADAEFVEFTHADGTPGVNTTL